MSRAFLLGLSLALAGCAAQRLREAAPEEGVVRSYPYAFERVHRAALEALSALELPAAEQRWLDRGRWSALGKENRPFGRAARVVVEDHPDECRVWALGPAEELHAEIARALGQEAPAAAAARGPSGEMEARYAAPLERCFELLAQVCRERGYEILRRDAGDPSLLTLTAERKPAPRLFAALYRLPDERTRVVVEIRGGPPEDNRAESAALHGALGRALN